MTATKYWYINCNDCGEEGTGGEGSHAYGTHLHIYVEKLRASGWLCRRNTHVCESCLKKRRTVNKGVGHE